MAAAAAAGPEDLVLMLLSGGASAMAEVPASGVSEQQIIDATTLLLASGKPITEINEQRKVLSALKGGGLTQAARPARVVTFAISDVPTAASDVIGSGPTTGSDTFEVLADGSTAARAVAQACREAGLEPEMLADPIAGPASSAGRSLGRASVRLSGESALIGFVETTVRVEGTGRGGRNQEFALAAALEIAGTSALVGSIGSDGVDGPTNNAGAIVDGTTIARGSVLGLDAATHLEAHDSATFLEAVGDVVVTGPTGTNVGDLMLAVKP
jgi:glycerate-2-kinase